MSSTIKDKDQATLEAMAAIYCKAHHESDTKDDAGLCDRCRACVNRTLERTLKCPNGHDLNCQDCSIKCKQDDLPYVREIMRYSAPRMLIRHPLMTLDYMKKKLRNKPKESPKLKK